MDETVKQLTVGAATPPENKAQMPDEMLLRKNGFGTDEQSLRTAIEKSDSGCMESATGKANDGDGQSAMEVEIIRSALRNAGYTNKVALPFPRPTE